MRLLRRLFFLLVLILGAAYAAVAFYLPQWAAQRLPLTEARIIQLEKGTRLPEFTRLLLQEGLIDQSLHFQLWVRFHRKYGRFQAGQYRFEHEVSPQLIAEVMEAGKTWEPFALQFVIPEGFTLKQVVERLLARQLGTRKELENLVKDPGLLAQFGIKGKNIEGYVYPATYTFGSIPSARATIEKMLQTFFNALPLGIEERLKEKNLSLHEGIIFASLIERETQVDEERPYVSEVIWNRLKAGEPLAIDAALIYGIKDYKGDIKWEHLRNGKNLYNNRIHKGLPPTPIGAISMESLLAVLNPTHMGYRFYVLRSDGSKRHHFTRTLDEHNVYVKQLIDSSR